MDIASTVDYAAELDLRFLYFKILNFIVNVARTKRPL
jgi:hypothetical protein